MVPNNLDFGSYNNFDSLLGLYYTLKNLVDEPYDQEAFHNKMMNRLGTISWMKADASRLQKTRLEIEKDCQRMYKKYLAMDLEAIDV